MLLNCGSAVYGVVFNFRGERERLGGEGPIAPVLYLRPRNTWNVPGPPIRMPADATELKMAGTLGAVIGLVPNQIAGYVAVLDVSIPHESYFRPAIKQRCRDGFCVIGGETTDRVPAEIRVQINGELRCRTSVADLVRPVDRLIADIAEFLTLQPGDIVLIGEPPDAPLARAGDRVRVEIEGLPPIENQVVSA
ncbi:MAG TPA: fumarylacetoacetate hydrolase family protein [Bryobacteraceae bacterium]|nr:fumarylacetoacetate hydrolase family protein [Bryobacteraceae bacterium]